MSHRRHNRHYSDYINDDLPPVRIENAIELLLIAREADGRAERTLKDYRRVLNPFQKWCSYSGKTHLHHLDRNVVRLYVAGLRKRNWAPNTVTIHIRYLRAFLRWCYEEEMIARNLAGALKAPRKSTRHEQLLTLEEFARFVAACEESAWALRDRALILTFADTGMRRGEIILLKRSDVQIHPEQSYIRVYAPKTDTSRHAFLGEKGSQAMTAYLESRDDDYEELWIGEQGPLTYGGLGMVLRRRAIKAGIDPARVHCHAFRKFFATRWIQAGGDTQRLQWLGGWCNPEMLETYVLLASKEPLGEAHKQYSPVDRALENFE